MILFENIPSSTLNNFVDYFFNFYDEKKGIYPIKNLTKDQVLDGIKTRIKNKPSLDFIGDSVDRELIRDIILEKKEQQ